MGLIERHY